MKNRRHRKSGEMKLNITSMMDMFTIILVFLLKSFSAEGQLVTPADGFKLPNSTIEKSAEKGLEILVGKQGLMIEHKKVLSSKELNDARQQEEYLIPKLQKALKNYSRHGKSSAMSFDEKFTGSVVLQGDREIPYNLLVKLMYTCGQAGFPNVNLIVFKEE